MFGHKNILRVKGIFTRNVNRNVNRNLNLIRNFSHRHSSDAWRTVKQYAPFGGDIQYLSDVHLDYNCWRGMKAPAVKAVAPYLVIAGDIGQVSSEIYLEFLKNVCQEFDQVLLVPGNHEYYDQDLEEASLILESYQSIFKNLEVLNNQMTSLMLSDGRELTVMGSTLWSAGPSDQNGKKNVQKIKILEQKMADYQRIFYQGRHLTVHDTDLFFAQSINWLWHHAPESDHDDPLLVVTHHAPLIEKCCHSKYIPYNHHSGEIDRIKWCNYSFASNLEGLINAIRPTAWIFGHTHYRTVFQYNNVSDDATTIIASNPVGRLPRSGVTKLLGNSRVL